MASSDESAKPLVSRAINSCINASMMITCSSVGSHDRACVFIYYLMLATGSILGGRFSEQTHLMQVGLMPMSSVCLKRNATSLFSNDANDESRMLPIAS